MSETSLISTAHESEELPVIRFEPKEAELLKQYQAFLRKYGLAEALFCKQCGHASSRDGCEAHVTSTGILIRCRCTVRLYQGFIL